jgi:ABC-type polar amino acid transport system ATPase subunit
VIRVTDLEKWYGATAALRGVSFEVAEGRLAAVVGHSGAGKSTLLRCLIGLETFDRGSIRVGDVEVLSIMESTRQGRAAAARALRGRIGLVFQSFELFPHLSVLENCTLAPIRVAGLTPVAAATRARTLLEQLGLGDKASSHPDHLSGGQRQRVAIARALAMEPRVLLYDEPTSALDPALRDEMRDTLERVRSTRVTQIIVTHDVSIARACEQRFVMDDGRIVEHGAPEAVLSAPQSEASKRLLTARVRGAQ